MSYFNGLILDTTNNYGIVTETLFSYVPPNKESFFNTSFIDYENLKWIVTNAPSQGRTVQEMIPEKMTKRAPRERIEAKTKSRKEKKIKKTHKRKDKVKKCFLKLFKKRGKKGGKNKFGLHSKYMLPLILGLVVAKSLLMAIVLKALTFIAAKGLIMGFFATALASVLSLKGMFYHSHGYQHRNDDLMTQVEIIRAPSKKDVHPYHDELYNRGDFVPLYKRTSYSS